METWQKVGACVLVLLAVLGGFFSKTYLNKSEALTIENTTIKTALSERTLQVTDLERQLRVAKNTFKSSKPVLLANGVIRYEKVETSSEELQQSERQINALSVELDSEIDKRIQAESRIKVLESSKPSFRHWGIYAQYSLSKRIAGGIGYHLNLWLLDAGIYGGVDMNAEPNLLLNLRF